MLDATILTTTEGQQPTGVLSADSDAMKVGDRVAWTTVRRVKKEIIEQNHNGTIVSIGKGCVVVEYAPKRLLQIMIGTLNLRHAA